MKEPMVFKFSKHFKKYTIKRLPKFQGSVYEIHVNGNKALHGINYERFHIKTVLCEMCCFYALRSREEAKQQSLNL